MASFANDLSLFFSWLVRTSVQASVLVCLILAVQALLRRRLAPRWQYCLWLLVLVRLVIPWAPQSSLSVFNLIPFWQPSGAILAPASTEEDVVRVTEPPPETGDAVGEQTDTAVSAPARGARPGMVSRSLGVMSSIWLAGALMIALYALADNLSVLAKVRRERPLTDQTVLELLEDCKEEIGTRTPLTVVQTERVKSPSLLGFVRPRLLLPEGTVETMSRDELRYVFLHEMAHMKRLDIPVNWLMTVLQILHWFNPFIWFGFYRMRADRELACDALVLAHARPEKPHEYGRTIVNLLERFSQRRRLPGMAGILEDKSQLKRRITSIAAFGPTPFRWSAVGVALLVLLACVALTDARTERTETPSLQVSVGMDVQAPDRDTEQTATEQVVAATEGQVPGEETAVTRVAAAVAPAPTTEQQPAIRGIGIALIEFSRVGSRETLGDASAQMYELVASHLAEQPNVRLVEREKLDKAFEELKLNQTGLVDAATATELGKIVGARVFIVGNLMKLGSEWVVAARLIDTQTSEVAGIRVTADESDGLLALADATSEQIAERLGTFQTSTTGSAETSAIDAEIERLRELFADKELPTVTVRVPESHLGRWVPDPAGENELISVLSRVGYRVVDISTFIRRQPDRWWLTIFHGQAAEGDGREIRVTQGFRSAADIMHDKRLAKMKDNANIFIMGEAFSEYVGENYGFRSCRARIELKAIDTATEQIALAASQHATAADVGEFIAGKTALKNAGQLVAVQLARDLAEYWEKNKPLPEKQEGL